MAEIKTGIFAKNVQKRLNRAQEKVLQKLGKADETKDEQFEQVVINFRRQESEGSRLQREMKSYMAAIKGMQQASINLTQSLHEVYEPDWHGKDDVLTIGKDCDALWEDFHNKVVDATLLELDGYLQQFPDLKTRVAKRSRKLIDYDSARHHVETLQASGMKNDRKMMKAEEELKKAQRVFDELNVGLQDELPSLWDSRVGFYLSTFKAVTSLEARFHREISLVCKQLYEVMTQLSEQHSDKMFTIQGAPSDSGPLRLARTPSPPDDESPPESPPESSNHMLRPVSPGPPRPKSPTQLKKGPPVPPPPKVTPTKEVAEEQIIDLFGGEFLPAPSPSQPNERPGESLLDLDFDAFQPDESVSPIPQTAVPWDMWSAQPAESVADTGFVADWSADFGSMTANGEASSGAEGPNPNPAAQGEQRDPQVDGQRPDGDADTPSTPQDSEAATEAKDEVSSWDQDARPYSDFHSPGGDGAEAGPAGTPGSEERRKSTPGLIFTNEFGEVIEESMEEQAEKGSHSPDGSGSEYETAEEWGDGGQGGGWASADDELLSENHPGISALVARVDVDDSGSAEVDKLETDLQTTADQPQDEALSILPESQGGGVFDSDPFAESQGGGVFDSDPFAESQGEGVLDSDLFAKSQQGGAFDSDPFAESQGGSAFDSDPFGESQGEGVLDSDLFAKSQGEGVFSSDPFAESQGEGVFSSDPFAESQGEGAFDSDPFAESQGEGVFSSDPFGESQGEGVFSSDPFGESQGEGAFDSDPFAESQQGGAFDSDPFAESQGEGALDSNLFAKIQCVDHTAGLKASSFAESSGEVGVAVIGKGSSGLCSSAVGSSKTETSGTGASSWQQSNASSSFYSSGTPGTSTSMAASAAQGLKDVHFPKIQRETENSDMSEDEAANRRFGKLYQEKDEDASSSFFADFDKMNEVNTESSEAQETLETDTATLTEESSAPPAGEADQPPGPPVDDVEDAPAPPVGRKDAAESSDSPREESTPTAETPDSQKPDLDQASSDQVSQIPSNEDVPLESALAPEERKESPADEVSEKMPIPSVVIEPASSNEGDDDRDADIISPTAISDNAVGDEDQTVKAIDPSGPGAGLPEDFLFKVETMHDFEAANSDELDLKRGDVVLVIPCTSVEDQDAGWLMGIKENDWIVLGTGAQKGLFPENFTQRLE